MFDEYGNLITSAGFNINNYQKTESDILLNNMIQNNDWTGVSNFLNNSNYLENVNKDYLNYMYGKNEQFQNLLTKYNKNQTDMFSKLNSVDTANPNGQTSWDSAAKGMDIFGSTMQGLGELSKMGLMWAQYAQNRKMINNQTKLVNEQIEASREYRQQRKDEIDRLNRARTYTKNAYGKGTTVTRSVM